MRVKILSVEQARGERPLVVFSSTAGTAAGEWGSRDWEPESGQMYDAELDINAVLDSTTLKSIDARPSSLAVADDTGQLTIVARVESVDGDNMAFLRISEDCLIMAELIEPMLPGTTVEIALLVRQCIVTPTGGHRTQ